MQINLDPTKAEGFSFEGIHDSDQNLPGKYIWANCTPQDIYLRQKPPQTKGWSCIPNDKNAKTALRLAIDHDEECISYSKGWQRHFSEELLSSSSQLGTGLEPLLHSRQLATAMQPSANWLFCLVTQCCKVGNRLFQCHRTGYRAASNSVSINQMSLYK